MKRKSAMKKFWIRTLCLLLVAVSIFPMLVACKKEPTTPEDESEETGGGTFGGGSFGGGVVGGGAVGGGAVGGGAVGGGTTEQPSEVQKNVITAYASSYSELTVLDPENKNNTVLIGINEASNAPVYQDGENTIDFKIEAGKAKTIKIPQAVDINNYYYMEFKMYAPSASDDIFTIQFSGDGTDNAGAAVEIVMDFNGWQTFKFKQDAISVKNPVPKITQIVLTYKSGKGGSTVYLSEVKATNPNFEYNIPEGININDPTIYDSLLDKRLNYKTANSSNTLSITPFTDAIDKINSKCYEAIHGTEENDYKGFDATYQEGVNGSLYGKETYNPSGDRYAQGIRDVYTQLLHMAIAYACKHSDYYGDEEVLDCIKKGLEYEFQFGYGQPVLDNGTYGDWYPWDANIPSSLIDILICVRKDLTQDEIDKYLSPFNKIMPAPYGTAANLAFMGQNVVLAAALQKNGYKIAEANYYMQEMFRYIDEIPEGSPKTGNDDGFYTDGSFIQHGGVPYQNSYGIGLLQSLVALMYIGGGTPFEITGSDVEHQYEWVFNSFRTICHDLNSFIAHDGRSNFTCGMERANVHRMLGCAAVMASYAPANYKAQLESMMRYFFVTLNSVPYNIDYSSIAFLEYMYNLTNDYSIQIADKYVGGKVFGAADTVVQHTAEYGVCVAMSSKRIMKYESINGANETGWYHRDGMIYIYSNGYDFGIHSWLYYADPYLMPGTTVNASHREDRNIWPPLYGSNDFAGGAEQGLYAVAGMILGYNESAATQEQKSFLDVNDTKITARKSYFMFDNEVVCIGSDINDWSGDEVLTVVENRRWGWNGSTLTKKTDYLYINGVLQKDDEVPTEWGTEIDARTMHFSNMGGYVFLRSADGTNDGKDYDGNILTYRKATHSPYASTGGTTSNKADMLEIKLVHGTGNGNVGGSYAYVYLPDATWEQTEDYYNNPDVVMLARDTNMHAVFETTKDAIGVNFFGGASLSLKNDYYDYSAHTAVRSIQADSCPASIIVSKVAEGYKISVSDPTHRYDNLRINITVEGATTVVSKDAAVKIDSFAGGTVKTTINTKNSNGRTFDFVIR